ncbi:hypothetical protein SAMN04487995_2280 [Dyadobacter koreensis]|uniref:Uncharacterized protein n=1 Tax=Dyadobacter koreensis TaxID=408657 RepID=A0A1H6TV69_9BACT|nr:hypothetical protein [Dyadobacter koreensis]SEI80115.1 hypothetical protein SAMN04487995_2280 [Dyadobacter koreensis]
MKNRLLFVIQSCLIIQFCLVGPSRVHAQLEQSDRLEIPTNSSRSELFEVFTLGNDGLLALVRGDASFGNRNESWEFTRYDTSLNPVWRMNYKLDYRYIPVMAYQGEHFGYWLFAQPDTDHFLFLQMNFSDGAIESYKGNLLSGIDVQQFKVIGSKAIVAGYHRSRPVVVVHSFFDQSSKVLPGLYEKNTELNNVDINEQDGIINVITYAYRKKNCVFEIKTYSYEGKFLKKTALSDPRNSLISGQIVPLNADDSYLIGNYSIGCTPYSQGLYITHISDNEPEKPEFIEFSELQNFFNYMKPKRRQRMMERIGKRKSLGKENRFRYRLLVHELIQTEDEIVLVAEVYYPNQRAGSPMMVTNGVSRPYYARSLEGYRYTHAIVCGFDRNGKFKWDNCIPIKDLTSFELQEMVQLTPVNDYFILAYPQEGTIHTEVINRSKVVVENEKFKISAKSESDKVINNENAYLAPWYGQYFLAYGMQRVGPSSIGQGRDVFYINKLTYKTESINKAENREGMSVPR